MGYIQQLRRRGQWKFRSSWRLLQCRITRFRHRLRLRWVIRQQRFVKHCMNQQWPWFSWWFSRLHLQFYIFLRLQCRGRLIRWWYRISWCICLPRSSFLRCNRGFHTCLNSQLIVIRRNLQLLSRKWRHRTRWHQCWRRPSRNHIILSF